MCLKNASELKTAKKDIVVYKYVKIREDLIRVSPYQYDPISIGTVMTTRMGRVTHGIVQAGFHSYRFYYECLDFCSSIYYIFGPLEVYKCVIPAGSKYRTGKFGNHKSIVSNQIKYINKCA